MDFWGTLASKLYHMAFANTLLVNLSHVTKPKNRTMEHSKVLWQRVWLWRKVRIGAIFAIHRKTIHANKRSQYLWQILNSKFFPCVTPSGAPAKVLISRMDLSPHSRNSLSCELYEKRDIYLWCPSCKSSAQNSAWYITGAWWILVEWRLGYDLTLFI